MAKRIDRFVYKQILTQFEAKIFDEEFTQAQQAEAKTNRLGIWSINKPGKNGDNFFKRLFKDELPHILISPDHFTRKLTDYEGDIPIKPEFLINLLRYIGVEVFEGTNSRDVAEKAKEASILYEIFRSACNNPLPVFKDFKNDIVNPIIITSNNDDTLNQVAQERIETEGASKVNLGSSGFVFDLSPTEIESIRAKRKFTDLIEDYFQTLSDKNYTKAFEFWHPEQRIKQWNDDISEFNRSKNHLRSLKLHSLLDKVTVRNGTGFFEIYYKVHLNSYFSDDLYDLINHYNGVEELPGFSKRVKLIFDTARKNKMYILDKSIHSFFDYSLVEYIHELAAYNPKALQSVFPKQGIVSFSRLAKIVVKENGEGKWQFEVFSDLMTGKIWMPHK